MIFGGLFMVLCARSCGEGYGLLDIGIGMDQQMNTGPAKFWVRDLDESRAHVWCVPAQQPRAIMLNCEQVLSSDEVERSARVRCSAHRCEFVIARGFLRHVLGGYIGSPPDMIRFGYGKWGKPHLKAAPNSNVCFNVAHGGGLVLIAVTQSRQIGVDVEDIGRTNDLEVVADFLRSGRQLVRSRSHNPQTFGRQLLRWWVRKESLLKASGQGLGALQLQGMGTPVGDRLGRTTLVRQEQRVPSRWWTGDLQLPGGRHVAAVHHRG